MRSNASNILLTYEQITYRIPETVKNEYLILFFMDNLKNVVLKSKQTEKFELNLNRGV